MKLPGTARPAKPTLVQRAEAYERLGVKPEQVAFAPRISHLIKKLDGGQAKAVELIRGSSEVLSRQFIAVYDLQSAMSHRLLPIEAYCVALGVPTRRLWELIMGEAMQQGAELSAVIAAVSHPAIVEATVASALESPGVDDRKMIFQHSGFLPTPKGSKTTINVNAQANASSQAAAALPPMDADVRSLSEQFQSKMLEGQPARQLPAAVPTVTMPDFMRGDQREKAPVTLEMDEED